MAWYLLPTLRIYVYPAYTEAKHPGPIFGYRCVLWGAVQELSGFLQLRSDGTGRRGAGGTFVGDAALRREEFSGQVRERWMRRGEVLSGDLLERDPELLASADELADGPVRLPERHAPRGEKVRQFRRERELAGGLGHAPAVEARRAEHLR